MASTDETLEERDALSARINETFDGFDRWRERYRDAGLTAILVVQAAVMFLVGPMAGAGMIRPELVEILRIAMAAIAVLIVNRRRVVGLAVTLVFAVTLITMFEGDRRRWRSCLSTRSQSSCSISAWPQSLRRRSSRLAASASTASWVR